MPENTDLEAIGEAERKRQRAKTDAEWKALWDEMAIYPGLVYTHLPSEAQQLAEIERICDELLVAVVWQDESIEGRRARADAAATVEIAPSG